VRNNDNCVFKVNFEIPENWNTALEMALKAVSVMKLDVGAVDLVWTGKNYYVIETNSGPGMGDQTSQWYADTLAQLIEHKKNNQ
jgi:glutathione synthase/RimK-type ligase-like ATP-grasp enzyme